MELTKELRKDIAIAKGLAETLSSQQATVRLHGGKRARVYVYYPRGYGGGAGGGDNGWIEVSGGQIKYQGIAEADLLEEVKAAISKMEKRLEKR